MEEVDRLVYSYLEEFFTKVADKAGMTFDEVCTILDNLPQEDSTIELDMDFMVDLINKYKHILF